MHIHRIYHPWTLWECVPAGFFQSRPPAGMTTDGAKNQYRQFLSAVDRFAAALGRVLEEWVYSCEHFLTNAATNRIAWLGQASMCIATGIPSAFRGGFHRLTLEQQAEANRIAMLSLNRWIRSQEQKIADGRKQNRQVRLGKTAPFTTAQARAAEYIARWELRGYPDGIPDDIPKELDGFVPSYRQIGEALLKNDLQLNSLGYSSTPSEWYGRLKHIELEDRRVNVQETLF